MTASKKPATPPLAWERDVSLLTNPAILGDLAKVLIIAGVLMIALVSFIVAVRGDFDAVLPLAGMMLLIIGGLFVLSLLIMLVIFGNRMRMAFLIDDRGIEVRVVDRRARAANRLAATVGALAGKPGVAGAGLIAMHDEVRSAVWSSISRVKYDPRRHTITLRNAWRTVLRVFCTPENYASVAARIAAKVAAGAAAVRPRRARRNPLWPTLGLTATVVLATLPLFAMPYPFEAHLFAVIFTLCFALATVWLVPLMAWAVLGGIIWIVGTIMVRGMAVKTNQFTGTSYTAFGGLDAGDLAGFMVVAIGLAVLSWIAVAALRGRITSLFMHDVEEMAGAARRESPG